MTFARSFKSFSAWRGKLKFVSHGQSHNRIPAFIKVYFLGIHVAWRVSCFFVMFFHSVISAPKLAAVGGIKERCVSRSVKTVTEDQERFFVFLPIFRVAKRSAQVFKHAEGVMI